MKRDARAKWLLAAGAVAALAFAALAAARTARRPYDHVLGPDPEAWRQDADLQRAVAELSVQDRNLLRLWMVRHAVQPGATPVAIGDAIAEVRARARNDPALRTAVELYTSDEPRVTSQSLDAFAGRSTP